LKGRFAYAISEAEFMEQIKTKRLLLTAAKECDLSVLEEIEKECTGNLYPDNFGGIGLMKNINLCE